MMFSNCCSNSKVCFLESHIRGATFQTGRTRGTTFHYINWFIDIPNKVFGIFPLYLTNIIPQYIANKQGFAGHCSIGCSTRYIERSRRGR